MNRPFLALALTSICCAAAAADRPPSGAPATESDIADEQTRPGDALVVAFLDWDAPVLAALAASPDARDRALAATSRFDGHVDETALENAAARAPDDALVQWLAASHWFTNRAGLRAAEQLTRLEPDNGAAWMLAYLHGERDAESALLRAAGAARFDDHRMDLLHAWLDAYARLQDATTPLPSNSPWSDRYAAAQAHSLADDGPAWKRLVDRCREGSPEAAIRRRACADLGVLMSREGSSLVSRTIGFAILRDANGGTLDAPEQAAQRQLEWYVHAQGHAFDRDPGPDPEQMAAIERDVLAANDEVTFIRNALRHIGAALRPPDDWISPREAARIALSDRPKTDDAVRRNHPSTPDFAEPGSAIAEVRDALAASTNPRDRVLAATTGARTDAERLRHDAALASDDALVQWLAATHLGSADDMAGAREAAARLTRLEPDNGATWMLALALDRRGIDAAAFAQATANASRFDDHSGDIARAWLDAWDRFAPQSAPSTDPDTKYSDALFTALIASQAGTVDLARACRQDEPKTGDLRAGCARLGTLMLQHGTSSFSRFHGATVLRKLDGHASADGPDHSLDEAERAALRLVHWYRFGMAGDTPADQRARELRAWPDWATIAQHRLANAGLPPEPPADWKPKHRSGAAR
jgi:hypothetical protein